MTNNDDDNNGNDNGFIGNHYNYNVPAIYAVYTEQYVLTDQNVDLAFQYVSISSQHLKITSIKSLYWPAKCNIACPLHLFRVIIRSLEENGQFSRNFLQ